MEELPILNITGGILMYIAKILILIASIIAVYRKKNTGSILLLLGIMSIIFGDIAAIVMLAIAGRKGIEQVVTITGVNTIIEALTFIFFAIGVLVYILLSVKQNNKAT